MYTDLKAELDEVQGGYCPGMEAPFGQLNIAFKRLTGASSSAWLPSAELPSACYVCSEMWHAIKGYSRMELSRH